MNSAPRGRSRSPLQGQETPERPVALLSVAIATLDRPDDLTRCLKSLLTGEVLPAEVIVVDQSQDDCTKMAVTQSIFDWRSTTLSSKTSITYLRQPVRGLSASRNLAFSHARYPLVAVTDDDCVPDTKWVSVINQVFTATNPPAAMGGRVLPLGEAVATSHAASSRTSRMPANFDRKVPPWVAGSGGNFAVKRDWWQHVGNYDERLGAGSPGQAAEDMDFIYKLLRARATVRYNPDAIVYHARQSQSRYVATRYSYGYGIGAFCGKWLRQRDVYALWMLSQWFFWHTKKLLSATVRLQNSKAGHSVLTLKGTLSGLVHGLTKF
jgi:glycosyltransferase involved in cell wall biosynthesis